MPNPFEQISQREPLLPPEEFFALFGEEWTRITRRFFKFESLQTYDEKDESGGIAEFRRGDYGGFAKKLRASRMEEKPFYDSAIRRGASFQRLRRVVYPLSEYLKFEFYTYFVSEQMGEDIRFLEDSKLQAIAGFSIPDLVLFDNAALFQYAFDGMELKGGYCTRDVDLVSKAGELLESLYSQAKPFTDIMTSDPEIVTLLKEAFT